MTKLTWKRQSGVDVAYTTTCGVYAATLFYNEQLVPGSDEVRKFWLLYMPPILTGVPIDAQTMEEATAASETAMRERLAIAIERIKSVLEMLATDDMPSAVNPIGE